jgi:acyl carrier protein
MPLSEVVTPESRTSNPPKAIVSPVVQPVEVKPEPIASQVESPQPAEVKPTSEAAHISQIANYLEPHLSISGVEPTPTVTENAASDTQTSSTSAALLEVVSDKTGYPSEMLELEMDLEADLGIDSIKRVEIMGSLQKSFPQLPKLSPEELVEKRTLAQIVQYLDEQMMVTEKKIA